MDAVAGRTEGLVRGSDVVRWEGWQMGMRQYHVSQINRYNRPFGFQDRMIDGRFAFFEHDHHFRQTSEGTVLEDHLCFAMPFGLPGALVGRLIMVPHIRGLMRRRFARLKGIAESERWREYIPDA